MARDVYPPDFHPDAINTRLVLRIYAWITLTVGLIAADNPMWFPSIAAQPNLPGVEWGRAGLVRLSAAVVAVLGFSALGMSRIENPVSRRRALFWFAIAHIYFGVFFSAQSYAVFPAFIPQVLWFVPMIVGVVLLFIALTCAHAPRLSRPFRSLFDGQEYLSGWNRLNLS